MTTTRIRDALRGHDIATSCWVTGTSPSNAEAIGHVGYDAVIIDMQHTMAGFESVTHSLLALAGTSASTIVRVPNNDSALIQRLLDAGADGIMCPLVNSVDDAVRFVDAVRYPPVGNRSFGAYRAHGGMVEYFRRANNEVLAIVQIETVQALAEAEEIAAVAGIDMLFPGPGDLAISHGREPNFSLADDTVEGWHRRIANAAHASDKWAGMLALTEEDVARGIDWGYDMLSPAMERSILVGGALRALHSVQAASESRAMASSGGR